MRYKQDYEQKEDGSVYTVIIDTSTGGVVAYFGLSNDKGNVERCDRAVAALNDTMIARFDDVEQRVKEILKRLKDDADDLFYVELSKALYIIQRVKKLLK